MRHVRDKHPKDIITCKRCTFVCSSHLSDKMKKHQDLKHGLKERSDVTEMTIPQSPVERTKLKPKHKNTSSTSNKQSAPKESPVRSPAAITYGIEDHPVNVTPIKKNLMSLFGTPKKLISPLPPTPKRRRVETAVRPDDSEPDLPVVDDQKKQKSNTQKDSSHLAVPRESDVEAGKRWYRFLGAPSMFEKGVEASKVNKIRKKAIASSNYKGSVLPYGYGCVRKEERVTFPDGTTYSLSATWVADPYVLTLRTQEQQTEGSPIATEDKSTNVGESFRAWQADEQETQTEDKVNSETTEEQSETFIEQSETIIEISDSEEEDEQSLISSQTEKSVVGSETSESSEEELSVSTEADEEEKETEVVTVEIEHFSYIS